MQEDCIWLVNVAVYATVHESFSRFSLLYLQYLQVDPDFLKAATVENVRKRLSAMDKQLIKKK